MISGIGKNRVAGREAVAGAGEMGCRHLPIFFFRNTGYTVFSSFIWPVNSSGKGNRKVHEGVSCKPESLVKREAQS
jgi:hypothetical protein